MVEDESVRMGGENLIPLDVTDHDHTCQPLCLESVFHDIDSVQDSLLEDMVSCLLSNKPSECQKIWSILSDILKLCCGKHAHMHDLHSFTEVPL